MSTTLALPSAIAAEQQVIGAVLLDPSLAPQVRKRLRPIDFRDHFHREVTATADRQSCK